ncbi:hypothetical protein [Mesorhizobium neociceri]|uniref:Uncharacterized protein n=1 Tax=Mesorhizobium neociceri TaxID=1307853 RepID=A0A838B2L7_9HYPH|nr:hypothetical protein [Mesorhizobium neociceri]MBA1140281.1 hypothetical protein [Mesorhizobium neociceri]
MGTRKSALVRALAASQVSETLANYELVDEPLTKADGAFWKHDSSNFYYDDQQFWRTGTAGTYAIIEEAISEWVARVPGLFWQKASADRRQIGQSDVENKVGNFITLNPLAKSRVVSGGIGTIRLPPSEQGYRLVTLTRSMNASAGVPALISTEVWEHHHLGEGKVIEGIADWRAMPLTWSAQFPSVAGVAKGCLVITHPDKIIRKDVPNIPVEVHPFSVMEYSEDGAQLHAFVYATAQTGDRRFRSNIETFFKSYSTDKKRYGVYLTGADLVQPMWETLFVSPEEMRGRQAPILRTIEARLAEEMQGDDTTDSLLQSLSSKDRTDLARLSTSIELPVNRWSQGGTVGDESIRLVDAARRAGKIPALLYALQLEGTP